MEWLGKSHSQNRTQFDGEVVLSVDKHLNAPLLQFKFRKNSYYKIINNCEAMVIAKDGNNIYFKEAEPNKGFKLCKWGVSSKIFKVRLDRFPVDVDKLGEYNLEFDSKLGLHYICLSRKLEKALSWEGK